MWNFAVVSVLVGGGILLGGTALAEDARVTGTFDTHDVTFLSHGAILSGTVVIPRFPVVAAAVFVQGAGSDLRPESQGEALARFGIAVLVYDKRGVGRSGGVYVGPPGGVNVSRENLRLLADDAAAAMTTLRKEQTLRLAPKGFIGQSQAGWIIPQAALKARGTRFMVFWSGAVETTHEDVLFEQLAAAPDFWDKHAHAEVQTMMNENANSIPFAWADYDPRTTLGQLKIPGLWLFGGRDRNVDVDLSIERLNGLIKHGHCNYEYRLYPSYDHYLGGLKVDVIGATVDWIRKELGNRPVHATSLGPTR
jgi:pimeloyl-ACP methyl ester carboxylesterase